MKTIWGELLFSKVGGGMSVGRMRLQIFSKKFLIKNSTLALHADFNEDITKA